MKTIHPRTQYSDDQSYPSVVDCDLSRRGFITAAVAGAGAAAAAALGAALVLPETASAGARRAYLRASIHLRHRFPACQLVIERLVVQSHDAQLIGFLNRVKERRGTRLVVLKELRRYKCADLGSRTLLAQMQTRLAKALAKHYRSRTGRRTATPIVTVIASPYRRPEVDGGRGMPSQPLMPGAKAPSRVTV